MRRTRVLLVRSTGRRRWQLPGGRLKRRETARQGARREVNEETGLTAAIELLSGAYVRSNGSVALVFLARVAARAEPIGPTHEIREQRWVPRKRALELVARRTRRRLREALALHGHRSQRALRVRRTG